MLRRTSILALGLTVLSIALPLAAQATAVAPAVQDRGYAALIGDFPVPGSDAAKADQAILEWLQLTRTPEEVARAQDEVQPHLGLFSQAAGQDLDAPRMVLTRALSADLQRDLGAVTASLKKSFARPRPYLLWPQIHPAVRVEPSLSYPSGHSAWGMSQAALLGALRPSRRQALLDRGRLVGYDRALAGVHYPSDVAAGQRLGAAFAEAWLAEPEHRRRVEQARAAEW